MYNNASSGSCIWKRWLIVIHKVECRQVLKGLHNREPWQARCSQVAICIHPQTMYMKQKNSIEINTKIGVNSHKNRNHKRRKTKQQNSIKRFICTYRSTHTNIHITYWIHDKTVHLQLLTAPLVVGTTGRSTRGLSLIGDTILHILNTVPVRARRIGPTGGQRQVLAQQHGVHNRPAVRGQLGQFTIIRPPVDET